MHSRKGILPMQKKPSKLIVKDSKGKTVQLLPEPALDYELNASSDRALPGSVIAEALAGIDADIVQAKRLDVTESEPTAAGTALLGMHSFVSWLQDESWTFTIDTEGAGTGSKTGQIPFCLYGIDGASLSVDWGDGTVSEYSSANASANSCPTHVYSIAGEYAVTISSGGFDRLYLWTNTETSGRPASYLSTLKSVDTPLPALAGTKCLRQNAVVLAAGSLEGCFSGCTALEDVIPEVFINNASADSLARAFKGCVSLTNVPEDIFEETPEVESLSECFSGCAGIARIGESLFAALKKAEDFSGCFSGCTSLAAVPERLFAENRKAENFSGCFEGCTSLGDFRIRIYSPYVTDASAFVTYREGASRNVAAADIGTSYSSFNSVASSLGLTLTQIQLSWTIVIDTAAYDAEAVDGQIPFCLRGTKDVSMKVDWGDGTVETFTSANAVAECISHEYASPGEYSIRMECADFDRLYVYCGMTYDFDVYTYTSTLKQVLSPLPEIAGTYSLDIVTYEGVGIAKNSMRGCFFGCSNMTSIPSNLFVNNSKAESFNGCFYNCRSLESIPSGIFECNAEATNFSGCFDSCDGLTTLPEGLFSRNAAAENFEQCFTFCQNLQTIPSGLFSANTRAESFMRCFYYCTKLGSFEIHISSSSVGSCEDFVSRKNGTTRTVYVPSGSATYTAFSNDASSLGLTVVQE